MSSFDTRLRLKAVRQMRNSKCPDCGQPIGATLGFAVHRGTDVLCNRCEHLAEPALAAILALLDPADPIGETYLGVIAATLRANTRCPVSGEPVKPRSYEIAGDNGRYLSVAAGEDACPALARALHKYHLSSPLPRPAPPPPPPPPSAEERAERERRERVATATNLLVAALGGGESPQVRRRAAAIVNAIQLLTA